MISYLQAKIYSLGLDESVFLKDPEDMDAYEKWLAHFDLEVKNDEIADLLTANPHLQLHYSQLVPDKVSHLVFWHRFYYRVQLIFDEEAQQKAKEKRENEEKSSSPVAKQEDSSETDAVESDMGAGMRSLI
jgi:Rps23 Pro-64 3,4-dihydroxylase Tpa1-like proline 4-hydroxylase